MIFSSLRRVLAGGGPAGDQPGDRMAVRTPIFEIGGLRALCTLVAAGLVATALYTVINAVAIRSIRSTLGIGKGNALCGEVLPTDMLNLSDLDAEAIPKGLKRLLDATDAVGPQRSEARHLWTRLCANLKELRGGAMTEKNPLQVGVEESERKTDEASKPLLPQTRVAGSAETACPDRIDQEANFAWLPLVCLRQRVLGIRPEERWPWSYLGIWRPVPQEAMQGTVYLYGPSRLATRAAGPRERRQLNVLQDFDKVLTATVGDLEEAAGLSRWLLRNLSGPFQWVILACGLWGMLLLGQLWLQAHWQRRAVVRSKGLFRQFEKDCSSRPVSEVTEQYFRWLSHSSSILVDWIIEIIPLLGFIGTVVGMIAAMASVARVVASDPGPELVNAMARVSDSLSLAFSTTFVALAFSILLYLLRPAVYRAQEIVVDTLPRVLTGRGAGGGEG